jgi:ribonuclease P protein component
VVGARSAVQRNRLRRRLRAAARPLVEANAGLDVLATVTTAWLTRPATDLSRELALAWSRMERQVLGTAGTLVR